VEEQRNANVVLTADVANYQQGVNEAAQSTNSLAASIDSVSQKLTSINKTAGKGLVGLGAGSAAGMVAMTAAASKFEKSLSTLSAQAAITNKNMSTMRTTVVDLSKNFPVSLQQSAQLVTMINQMGVASEQQINKMSNALVKLSGATGADLISVSYGLVELGRTMGTLNSNNIDKYANSLVNVSAGSGVAAEAVLEFSNSIGPVARLAGMGEQQVLGISGAFAKAGADGYAGATAFNRLVYGLTRTLQFGGPELKTYSNLLGVTSEQLQAMDSGEVVIKLFESLNKEGPLAIKTLDSLGLDGLRTIRSIQAVINQGDLRSTYEQAFADTDNLTVGAEAAFSGLNDELQRFRNNLTGMAVDIGAQITRPLSAAMAPVNAITGFIGEAVDPETPVGSVGSKLIAGAGTITAGVAGTAGLAMLAAPQISKLVMAGMGATVLRSGWGAMQMGRFGDAATGTSATMARRILDDPANKTGIRQYRPSVLMASAGQRIGERMGPGSGGVSFASRVAAAPIRSLDWLTRGQQQFVQNSALITQAPMHIFGESLRNVGAEVKNAVNPLKLFGKESAAASAATKAATARTIGLSAAFANLSKSVGLLGATYGRAAMATAGQAMRGVGSFAMGLAGGPTGLAIMGTIGALMGARYIGTRANQTTEGWETLTGNVYSDAAGQPGTATASYAGGSSAFENYLTPDRNRKAASRITPYEESLATGTSYEYVNPEIEGMSESTARALVMSMGYMKPEAMQQLGQDLTARFGRAKAQEMLSASRSTFTPDNSAQAFIGSFYPGDIIKGIEPNYSNFGGFTGITAGMRKPETHPFTKQFWSILAGGLPEDEKAQYETAVEQLGTRTSQISSQYGSKAGDAASLTGIYGLLSEVDPRDRPARNYLESRLADVYKIDFDYPGWDASGGPSPEELQKAIAGATFASGKTGEEIAQSMGFTLDPEGAAKAQAAAASASYQGTFDWNTGERTGDTPPVEVEIPEYVDLSKEEDREKYLKRAMETSKTFSEFQQTALGGLFEKRKILDLAASDQANDQIKLAEKLLAAGDKTGSALKAINEAAAQAPQELQGAFDLAKQLEDRRFDQNLWRMNLNTASQGNVQIARAQSELRTLDPASDTYDQDRLAAEDALLQAKASQRDYYESVLLAHRQFNISMERADEEYGIARARAIEDQNRQVGWAYEDFYRNQMRAREDFDRSMARMVEDSMAQVYDPYTRINTQPTLDSGNLIVNLKEQNQALVQQEKDLRRLKKMGVSQDAIDFLGLADPKNAQQLARLITDIRSDPKVIKELNKLTEGREDATGDLVASKWSRQYRRAVEDFERQSRRARQDFMRQMDRNNTLFDQQLSRMAADHKRQMDNALEDFNIQFKEYTGKFGSIEQRALNVLKDAGVKVLETGERQMDKIIRSLSRKYNMTTRMIDRLIGLGSQGGGGGAPGPVSSSGYGSGGTIGGSYKGTSVTIQNAGSASTAPTISPKTRLDAAKQDKRNIDDNLDRRNKFLKVAYRQLGEPYNKIGDAGPDAFDCSGLVKFSAEKAGLSGIPHSANSQINMSRKVPASKALPGDLVGFELGDRVNGWDHIGIYVGAGKMIHANKPGGTVHVANIADMHADKVQFAKLRGLKDGGVATKPMVAEIAEAGHSETVIPLNQRGHDYMTGMYKAISKELVKEIATKQLRLPVSGLGGGGNSYINASTQITGDITVKADDPAQLFKQLESKKRRDNLLRPKAAKPL